MKVSRELYLDTDRRQGGEKKAKQEEVAGSSSGQVSSWSRCRCWAEV